MSRVRQVRTGLKRGFKIVPGAARALFVLLHRLMGLRFTR